VGSGDGDLVLVVTMCKCTGCQEGHSEDGGYHDEKEEQLSRDGLREQQKTRKRGTA
jgi:hypothetical protein